LTLPALPQSRGLTRPLSQPAKPLTELDR
jgi:hypothetical protein